MTKDEQKLFEILTKEMILLRKMVHYQRAQLDAIGAFFSKEVSETSGKDKEKFCEDLEQWTRRIYDKQLSEIEKLDAGYAARIDFRADLDSGDQSKWYLP